MSAIETYLTRVQKMAFGRSKEMRMTYDEANELAVEIGLLLNTRLNEKSAPVIIHGGKL